MSDLQARPATAGVRAGHLGLPIYRPNRGPEQGLATEGRITYAGWR
ncbi:hypothetical protein JL2886_03726 [Phaeobacter gallaeciensis]|uniref:Uncharacterized protein n=1 Tax=Phaeobacter gallaeciensis TaxID=60890 RepID=A0A1B0ZWV5_9RHOB|nr:hypothetical protein JL2886_03726 [Phaeobacter gallaeciensis]